MWRYVTDRVLAGLMSIVGLYEEIKSHRRVFYSWDVLCAVADCEEKAVRSRFCEEHWNRRIMWFDTLAIVCPCCGQAMFSYEVRLYSHAVGEEVRCIHCGRSLGNYGGGILLVMVGSKEE